MALPPTPASDGGAIPEPHEGEKVYVQHIHNMREYELTTLYVNFRHLLDTDDVLADAIQRQYYRFLPFLRRALVNLVAEYEPEYLKINPSGATTDSANQQARDFNVAFYELPIVSGIRDLKTEKIGTLMSISGTVTRTSEVRPELLSGSFVCEACKGIVNDVEQQFKYTEVRDCSVLFATFNRPTAFPLPQSPMREPYWMATADRCLQVHRLAESAHPGESFRDSYWFHATFP